MTPYALKQQDVVKQLNSDETTGLTSQQAKELLARVGLAERMTHLPTKLSGGECQRVAIARALINRPPLILADEPTGNLDECTGEAIMQLIIDICREQNTALLLVTHNLDFAARTDRRLVLRHGILEEIPQ